MKTPCTTHKRVENKGYNYGEDRYLNGREQRQCPACLLWFFHGEFGKGWKAATKPPEEKFKRAQITMTPEHFTATAKDRSGMVRRALEFYPKQEIDYCIVGMLARATLEVGESGKTLRLDIDFYGGASVRIENIDFPPPRIEHGQFLKVTAFRDKTIIELVNPPTP